MKSFKELLEEYEAQNAQFDAVKKQLNELAEAGVNIAVPRGFLEAFDEACEVRATVQQTIPFTALRA